jgi:chemotaxis response regulator CheB
MLGAVAATSSRVLLFAMQPLLRDILQKPLTELPGIELVSHERPGRLADAAIATRADVVIADESAASPEDVGLLLEARPLTRALAVSHDGRSGVLYELRPQRHAIGDLSVESVLAAMTPPPSFPQQLVHESAPRPTP